jgi:hypothetical protein
MDEIIGRRGLLTTAGKQDYAEYEPPDPRPERHRVRLPSAFDMVAAVVVIRAREPS